MRIRKRKIIKLNLDETSLKLINFLKSKPSREEIIRFRENNPGVITYVSKEELKAANKQYLEFMRSHPEGSEVLKMQEDLRKEHMKRKRRR